MDNGRRVLYHPRYVEGFRDALAEASADLAAVRSELARVLGELARVTAALRELQAASLARQQAHAELVGLHRERALRLAERTERDPALPLN